MLWYLRVAAWQVPELADLNPAAVARHEAALRALHMHFATGNELVDEAPRILVRHAGRSEGAVREPVGPEVVGRRAGRAPGTSP